MSWSSAGRMLVMGDPATTKMDVAPVSAMACVSANASTLGMPFRRAEATSLAGDLFDVITVALLLLFPLVLLGSEASIKDIMVTFMTIYLLRPTPSEVWKLRLVLCLSASIIPRVDVLLGIAPIVCFLMIGMSPCLGTCVAILHIEFTRETHIHVAVSFDDVEVHRDRITCRRDASRCSRYKGWHNAPAHPTLARRAVGKWGVWCAVSAGDDCRGASSTPKPWPSASTCGPPWLEASNGWNVEMGEGGVLYRRRVTRSIHIICCIIAC